MGSMAVLRLLGGSLLTAIVAGCASYATPGGPADFRTLGVSQLSESAVGTRQPGEDSTIEQTLAKRPLASLPTGIAVVRIQAPSYQSKTAQGWGKGNYSVVTTRDVETPEQLERLTRLPSVLGIAPINRLLLPEQLTSDRELRGAAAALHADMLLAYTLDTTFHVEDKAVPLTVVTLGLSPNQQARVICTASAVLLDTRNGYVYGMAEATERQSQLTSAWTNDTAVDEARRRTESAAFERLVGELEKTWGGVVRNLAKPLAASVDRSAG